MGGPIAGFAVTLFILHVGWEVTGEILHHLMDGVELEHLEAARVAARGVPGVVDVVVRGRWMGRSLLLEVEGQLPSATSLARAEEIGRAVKHSVRQAVEEVRQVSWIPRTGVAGTNDPAAIGPGSQRA